jgi:DNA-binding phage protein
MQMSLVSIQLASVKYASSTGDSQMTKIADKKSTRLDHIALPSDFGADWKRRMLDVINSKQNPKTNISKVAVAAGLNKSTLRNVLMEDKRSLTMDSFFAVCHALDVSSDYIAFGKDVVTVEGSGHDPSRTSQCRRFRYWNGRRSWPSFPTKARSKP